MSGMTLPLQTQDSNSNPGGLRPGTLALASIFVSFKPPRPGNEPRTLARKAAELTATLEPPPLVLNYFQILLIDVTFYI